MGKTAAEKRYVRDLNARLPEGVNRCSFCELFNRGIGHLGDSVERLMIAAKYLGGEHGANS